MQLEKLKIQYGTIVVTVLLVVAAILIAYLSVSVGVVVAPVVVVMILGVISVIAIFWNFKIGVYLVLLLGIFMFYVERVVTIPVPLGIVYDLTAALTFFALFFTPKKNLVDWSLLKNPVTYFFILITVYQLLQVFNPSATSLQAWLVSLRSNSSFLIYFICFHLLKSVKDIKFFTAVFVGISGLIALYGIYQEVFGLTAFEWRWIYESPTRFKLYYVWGHMRKFSFLSDPSAFGLFMSFGGIVSLILSFGPVSTRTRLALIGLAAMMFISMSFSGTRTAYAMVPVGVALYILLTIRTRKTMVVAVGSVLVGGFIMFGPVHGGAINRIRSTFEPSEDASMGVRDEKRTRLQPYILSHPLGGGPNTVGRSGTRYSPTHELAGGWDPDSGYLATALELGWIGLIIFVSFFSYISIKGISNSFSLKNPLLRNYNIAFLIGFFALSVGHFTQHAMFQRSLILIVICIYALMERLPTIDKSLENQKHNLKPS